MKAELVRRLLAVLAIVVFAGGGLVACGDDGDEAEPATSAPGVTEGGSSNPGSREASGEAVRILQLTAEAPELGVTLPDMTSSLQGRIDRLNREGGVLGRPVEVDICIAAQDPNRAAECARRAVEGGYLAAVGSIFPNGGDYHNILAAANIPDIGYQPFDQLDGTAPNGFPIVGGSFSLVYGAARRIAEEFDPERVVVMQADSAAGAAVGDYARRVLDPLGIEVVPLPITRNKPDLSAEIQSAMSDGDAIFIGTSGADMVKIISGLVQANYKNFVVTEPSFQPALIKALGGTLDGVRAVTAVAVEGMESPGREQYLADLAGADPDQAETTLGKEAWLAGELFAQAAAKLTEVDSRQLLETLGTISDFHGGQMIRPVDFTKPGSYVDGQPNIRNIDVLYCTFKGGKCPADTGQWVNPLDK